MLRHGSGPTTDGPVFFVIWHREGFLHVSSHGFTEDATRKVDPLRGRRHEREILRGALKPPRFQKSLEGEGVILRKLGNVTLSIKIVRAEPTAVGTGTLIVGSRSGGR